MSDIKNNATFIGFGFAGVAHYRCAMPASALGQGLFIRDDKTLAVKRAVGTIEAPVIIYSQPFNDFQLGECAEILANGGKLIIDVDDDLRSILGKTDLLLEMDEDRVKLWEGALKAATLVTCSTQYIADSLRKRLGVNTMVCPNAIDLERFNIAKFPRNKKRTILGWSGGAGHLEALERIAPAIEAVMDEREDVGFVSIGEPAPGVKASSLLGKHAGSDRVYDAGFGALYEYPVMMSQFHIGLAPAVDNEFYRGKSDIRFLEQSAAYVYTIGQLPTYKHIMEGCGWYLTADATVDEWREALMHAISDPKLRYQSGLRARKHIAANRTMQQTAPAWQAAIDRALEIA